MMSDHAPTITVWRWLPSACIFNVETIARFHAYQSVVVAVGENCHAKGRKLTPRIYSQLRQVDHRSLKISAVFSMLLQQNRSIFCWFIASAARSPFARLVVNKKFLEEKIFTGTNFCELVLDWENYENFSLAKILRYTVHDNLFLVLSQHSMPSWQLTVSMHQIGSLICNQHDKLTILYLTV